MSQHFLFNPFNNQAIEPPKPVAPPARGVPPEDAPRLKGQNGKIINALLKGPATNRELSDIALKYTSRLSDIRKWLKEWWPEMRIEKTNLGNGLFEYSLNRIEVNE